MAKLTGTADDWPQAQAAASVAHRYFLTDSAFLDVAFAALRWSTGATMVPDVAAGASGLGGPVRLLACVALVLAAMTQSALVPLHGWLFSLMTTPTPASALMHAGFANAGGILLLRFAPAVTLDAMPMLSIAAVGTTSVLLEKLLKNVQPDVKSELGCSAIGQMGFVIIQTDLSFFGAAITHFILHGFYKAYHFFSAGGAVEWAVPPDHEDHETGAVGSAVIAATGLAGGVLSVVLTGKDAHLDNGLLLVALIVFATLHAIYNVVAHVTPPATARCGAMPLAFLPAIAVYALIYQGISNALFGLSVVEAPAEPGAPHALVAGALLMTYVTIELGAHGYSQRLYVTLLNASQPTSDIMLTVMESYNEH